MENIKDIDYQFTNSYLKEAANKKFDYVFELFMRHLLGDEKWEFHKMITNNFETGYNQNNQIFYSLCLNTSALLHSSFIFNIITREPLKSIDVDWIYGFRIIASHEDKTLLLEMKEELENKIKSNLNGIKEIKPLDILSDGLN